MPRLLRSLLLAMVAALAVVAPASAGTYTVNACAVGERVFGNALLRELQPIPVVAQDQSCSRTDATVGITLPGGAAMGDGREAILGFDAPAGMTIADFAVTRRAVVRGAPRSGHHPYVIGVLGGTVFEGAGQYTPAVKRSLRQSGSWFGDQANEGSSGGFATATRANRPALASYAGDATQLSFRVGCLQQGSVCDPPPGGIATYEIQGLSVTLNDVAPPALTVQASGLLGGGTPAGNTPVALDATDAAGIQSAAIIDVTDPAAPQIVGGEIYDPGVPGASATGAGRQCQYRAVKACPDLAGETVVPTALSAGTRQLIVRVSDPAGNVADAGPYRVEVATPSDRGNPNGAGATENARITAGFTTTRRSSRTVDAGTRPTIRGTLTNEGGGPISGAVVDVYTRDTDAERYVRRGTVRTGQSGRYELRAQTPSSRFVRVVWRAYERDTRTAATDAVKVRVKARASLSVPRRVSVGQRFSLTGTLRGSDPPAGVRLLAQAYERGRYRTFESARSDSRGRFRLSSRLFNASSRGRTFRLRVKILPRAGWPYTTGTTRASAISVR